jgi:hypothetical protein
VHLGNTTTKYAPGLTVHHKGYVNATTALDRLVKTFAGATDVVVIGESAGSIAAPLYAALAADRLPRARVTALADGSGSYPDAPRINALISRWGFGNGIPPWPNTAGRWSFPGLFIRSARHDPKIVLARHDYAYDDHQAEWYPRLGMPTADILARIDANEKQIEHAGVKLLSYIAPGDDHTALTEDELYTETVNGEKLVDWVRKLAAGKPVHDVHCKDCRSG